jgi:hypothetical protein
VILAPSIPSREKRSEVINSLHLDWEVMRHRERSRSAPKGCRPDDVAVELPQRRTLAAEIVHSASQHR